MSLSDIIQSDAALFVATSDFGETVTYRNKAGATRSISANVYRQPPNRPDQAVSATNDFTIEVINSATTGISSSEIDLGADKILLSVRIGETARYMSIAQIVSQDTGIMRLKLR